MSCYLHAQNSMFLNSQSFNQDIGNWDVSNGIDFVSIVMNINIAMNESSLVTHNLWLPDLLIFIYRIACLKEHLYLIKTLAIGMFQAVLTLWVCNVVMYRNTIMYESTQITILHFCVIVFMYRLACLLEHYHLTNTLVNGMCQVVLSLWVLLWIQTSPCMHQLISLILQYCLILLSLCTDQHVFKCIII